jgi:hypothetical protein
MKEIRICDFVAPSFENIGLFVWPDTVGIHFGNEGPTIP